MQRQAIGRGDVETDAGKQHDATGLRFSVLGVKRLEDRDFAGDVEIRNARAETRARQRFGRPLERPGAVENDRRALEHPRRRPNVREAESAALDPELGRERIEFRRIAAGEDGREAGAGRRAGDMPADESGGAVNEQL